MPIILYLITLPILAALIIAFIPEKNQKTIKAIALITAFSLVVLTGLIFLGSGDFGEFFQIESHDNFELVYNLKLQHLMGSNFLYKIFVLGFDNLSISFVLLTTVLMLVCFMVSNQTVNYKIKEYYICLLMLEGLIIGAFTAVDLFLFYFFFEASLIPIFIIILGWGSENRGFAALKLFLFTFAGSLLLLIAIIFIFKTIGYTDILTLVKEMGSLDYKVQLYLCIAMLIAFAIKIPMWPFHTWLPDAHVQAPTAGSMMLAGILIKLGAYAMIRFCLCMFPQIMSDLSPIVFALSIIAIIYASLVAFVQDNIKKMIAYSSVAHMGYVTIGIFSNSNLGLNGAIFQMISHGLISAGLFYGVGILYERFHTKQISELGGVAHVMPKFSLIFVFLTMASIGLPTTSGFVGEFLVLTSLYGYNKFLATLAGTGIILGAVYMLLMLKKVIYGEPNIKMTNVKDLNNLELLAFIPLIALIIILGIYPSAITAKIEPVVTIINNIAR
jgi:NADH-quinone oxidoreductase subunit M